MKTSFFILSVLKWHQKYDGGGQQKLEKNELIRYEKVLIDGKSLRSEFGWRKPGESLEFADEMRLIAIVVLVGQSSQTHFFPLTYPL